MTFKALAGKTTDNSKTRHIGDVANRAVLLLDSRTGSAPEYPPLPAGFAACDSLVVPQRNCALGLFGWPRVARYGSQ